MIISAARADDLAAVLALEESGFEPAERWSPNEISTCHQGESSPKK